MAWNGRDLMPDRCAKRRLCAAGLQRRVCRKHGSRDTRLGRSAVRVRWRVSRHGTATGCVAGRECTAARRVTGCAWQSNAASRNSSSCKRWSWLELFCTARLGFITFQSLEQNRADAGTVAGNWSNLAIQCIAIQCDAIQLWRLVERACQTTGQSTGYVAATGDSIARPCATTAAQASAWRRSVQSQRSKTADH